MPKVLKNIYTDKQQKIIIDTFVKYRKHNRITQNQMADIIGIHPQSYFKIERYGYLTGVVEYKVRDFINKYASFMIKHNEQIKTILEK